jgi:hypothetical protein
VHEGQVVSFLASSFEAFSAAAVVEAAFAASAAGEAGGNILAHITRPSVNKPQIHNAKTITYSIYFMTVARVLEDSALVLLASSAGLVSSALIFPLTVGVMKDIRFAGYRLMPK